MKKAKFIQIGKYFPPVWGGIETVTYELHNMFNESGLETHVFANQKLGQKRVYAHKFIKIFKVPISLTIILMVLFLKRNSTVLLHLPNPFVLLVCSLKPAYFKVRVIWHAPARSNFLLTQLNKISYRLARKNIKEIIIPYDGHRNTLPKNWTEIKTRVLKFPLDKRVRKTAEKTLQTRINGECFRVIIIGRLVDYKNHELTLDAVHDLISEGMKIEVDIVGSGHKYQRLKTYCYQKKLDEHVHFFGSTSDEEKYELLKKADCLTLVSKDNREMLGMVQYEAYAHGVPVIVTNIEQSSVASLARESKGAIVIQNKSKDQLKSAIMTLMTNAKLRVSYGKSGQDFIRKNYNYDIVKLGWENILSN